jgi:hypothetical protein
MMPYVTVEAVVDPIALDESFWDFSCKKDDSCDQAADRTDD